MLEFVSRGLSRMESVCAVEGFYQRETLTGIPVWDCPSNSCVPQEALHKKQLKNAQRHSIFRQSVHGEHLEISRSFVLIKNRGYEFKINCERVTEEVQSLKNRVELLEQKLQLVLAPFTSLFPMSLDEGVSEKTSFLSHSFQQLDRIDSLSEQIGFLEERLGTCSCQEN
ncbi:unnamed protein product [Oncorhynchus mykiss]|uniref:Uncharacterized protein n=1 Tax=Oncorhynchus mykiss TaxID=8022 RepID=A0A060VX31_ONCMY|nr:unnamed protein product [Oncorhynchus mykiss]